MAPAFSKEAILQGRIDHLCLVCESYLKSERDVCLHVSTPEHRRNLDSTDYVDQYRNDGVRKVKKWYFCEFCNDLVSTFASVRLHVKETRHMESKLSQMIARVDGVIIANDTAISEEAWHGLIDEKTCIVCDVEYDNQDVHKNELNHVINLIQSKVSDDNSYRIIGDSTFHCLTCNEVVADITPHLDELKHKETQQSIKKILIKQEENKINIEVTHAHKDLKLENKSADNTNKQSSDILDSIPEFQKNNININFESCVAVCRRCSMNLEFSCEEIKKHIEEHKNIKNKTKDTEQVLYEGEKNKMCDSLVSTVLESKEKSEDIEPNEMVMTENNNLQKVAEEHGLTYTAIGNKVFCQQCNRKIPSSVKNIVGHVNGELHRSRKSKNSKNDKVETKTKKCSFPKIPFVKFMKDIMSAENILTKDIIVNDKYCVHVLSFGYFTLISPKRVRCHVCEVSLRFDDIDDHSKEERHSRAMNETPVVIFSDSEFIREVRSEIFQCGYCNIYDSWEGMTDHLKSSDHKEKKEFASARLSQYLQQIAQERVGRYLQEKFLELLFS